MFIGGISVAGIARDALLYAVMRTLPQRIEL